MEHREACAHCEAPIVDPTTQVNHGGRIFCCANCAAAMEQQGSGSDPRSPAHPEAPRCARCTSPIVDDRTMEMHGGDAFCCRNCYQASRSAVRGG